MPLTAGTRLGPYEIIAPLGEGGMREVYKARDTKLGRTVAIKVLPHDLTVDAERLARFQREGRVLAPLNHPHIGGIYLEAARASELIGVIVRTTTLFLILGLAACSPSRPAPAEQSTAPSAGASRLLIPEATPEPVAGGDEIQALLAPATGDLDAIVSRGTVRVLVASNPTDYTADGGQHGAAFDAGKAFEAFARASATVGNAHLRVVLIPLPPEQLLSALTLGRGDIIAGRFAHTFERDDLVSFSEPIVKNVREVLVTGPGVTPIVSLEDVAGRSIHVRRGSDHAASLARLNGQLAKIKKATCTIVPMDPALTDEDLLRMVNASQIPVTLVDDVLVTAWRSTFNKIAVNTDVAVSQDGYYAWVVRKDSSRLLGLINAFVQTHDFTGLDARAVAHWRKRGIL